MRTRLPLKKSVARSFAPLLVALCLVWIPTHGRAGVGAAPVGQVDAPRDALQSIEVSGLTLSAPGEEGEVASRFDEGIETILARFDYEDASRTQIAVVVKGRGGIIVFRSADRYTGSDTAEVEIRGSAMIPALVATVDDAAREARRNADQAGDPDRTVGTQEYLRSVQAGILRVGYGTETLTRTTLPAAIEDAVAEAHERNEQARRLVERALDLPHSDVVRKKELAAQAAERLGAVVAAAGQMEELVVDLGDIAIPTTGHTEQAAYTVQLEVEGDVAASTDLWVYGPIRIHLPIALRGAPLQGGGGR